MELKSTRHSVYLCNYHIVFIPKYRRPVLVGEIADTLKEIFYRIVDKYGMKIIALEIMPDHIHLFVSAPPKYSPAQIVKYFKGISSKWIKKDGAIIPNPSWRDRDNGVLAHPVLLHSGEAQTSRQESSHFSAGRMSIEK